MKKKGLMKTSCHSKGVITTEESKTVRHSEVILRSNVEVRPYSESLKKTGLPRSRWLLAMTGFTLAEVLITLSILGVVAAIAIPNIIQNYKEKETVVKVKKAYATLQHAFDMAFAYYGEPSSWGNGLCGHQDVANGLCLLKNKHYIYSPNVYILKEFLPLSNKNCAVEPNASTSITDDCYLSSEDEGIKFLNGNYVSAWGSKYAYPAVSRFILKDGTFIGIQNLSFCTTNSTCAQIMIDINGKKKPNMWGKDIFFFNMNKNGISPSSANCNNTRQNGDGCAQEIITKGKMNYLHK